MIKNLFRFIFLIMTAAIVLLFLFIFDFPPFNKAPATPETTKTLETKTETEQKKVEEAALPPELKEKKVAREKTYDEAINRAKQLEKAAFYTLAIAEYQYAYSKNNTDTSPLFAIGKIYLQTAKFDKAETIYTEILRKDPNSLEAKISLTKSLIGQREISKAKEIINNINGDNQESLYLKGIISAFFGDHETAKRQLQDAKNTNTSSLITKNADIFLKSYNEYKFNTESPGIHLKVLLARSYNQVGEYQMAIPILFEVSKEKLDYRDAWILLGYAYLQIGKNQDAIEALERARILDPEKAETNFYLGLAQMSVNNFKKAEEYLQKAKENGFEPKVQIDQKLAEIYLQLQSYSESAAAYENVLNAKTQDIDYYIRPIWIHIEKTKQPEKALRLALDGVKKHPDLGMSHNLLGWALIANNNLIEAEKELNKALNLDPLLDATQLNLGLLNEKKGEYQIAIQFYKKAHQLGAGNSVSELAATHYNSLIAKTNNQSFQANLSSKE